MAYKRIGLLVAMDSEFDLARGLLGDASEIRLGSRRGLTGAIGDKETVLLKTGIGKVNAACTALELMDGWHPDAIINTGVAGGIDRCLSVGDIVVGTATCYHDFYAGEVTDHLKELGFPDPLPAHSGLLDPLRRAASGLGDGVKFGLICTGDQFITNNDALKVIKGKRPDGLAVDMESNAVAHACFTRGLPFVSFRVISDTPWVNDQAAQYARFWEEAPQKNFRLLRGLIGLL